MALQSGLILNNRYRIVRLLGQGGFGAVYRAWDINLSRPCALKENLNTSPAAQHQFEREAIILAGLTHPNLPRVTDHFFLPGQGQYLVMDFIEGDDSQQILQRSGGPLPEAQVLGWILQICDALDYLHTRRPPVIHRDIKPANIKITPDGRAMLVDFGIAKQYDPDARTTLGARAVTSGFSPPEQYGRGVTDAQSDLYALGATLYALLSGQTPADSVDRMTSSTALPPLRRLNPSVSPQVEAAVAQAMELDKSRRPGSVAAFAAALRSAAAHRSPVILSGDGADFAPSVHPGMASKEAGSSRPLASNPLLQVARPGQLSGQAQMGGRGAAVYPQTVPDYPVAGRTPSQPVRGRALPAALGGAAAVLLLACVTLAAWYLLRDRPSPALDATMHAQATAIADAVLATASARTGDLAEGQATATQEPTQAVLPSATAVPATAVPATAAPPTALPPTAPPTAPPTSSLPAAIIEPYCAMFKQSPQYVKIGQPVILWWRWDAATSQQVEDHIAAASYTITLDGSPILADRRSEIEYLSDKGFYRVSWFADVGVLAPGTHHAERLLTWARRITDGWTTFGPGGKTESERDGCEIVVR